MSERDDGLTDEERAALAEDDGEGDEVGQHKDDSDPAKDDKGDHGDKAKDVAKEDQEHQHQDATAVTDAVAVAEDTSQQQQPAPILVAPPPNDAVAKLAEIEARKETLLEQFDNGDVTAKEYQKQLDTISKEERAIERAQDRAELAAQMDQQRLQNDWNATCANFVESHTIYKDNPRLYKALDAEVRELAAKPETASWSGQKFLDEAHRALKQAFGFSEGVSPERNGGKPAPRGRELPPNLAKVPAADVQDTNGGRFAVLDRLATSDPIAYEETLSKMSQHDRDSYLSY
jgi:hypothetical protein